MTNFEKIKAMNEEELAVFLTEVSSGVLPGGFMYDNAGGRDLTDFDNGFCSYDKTEYIRDYLGETVF